ANLRKALVTAEFILMALVEQKDSIVLKVFDELRLDTGKLRREIVDRALTLAQSLPDLAPAQQVSLQVSQDVTNLFQAAWAERKKLGDGYISTGALFLGCFDSGVPGTKRALIELALDYEACAGALLALRGHAKIDQKDAESRESFLDEYATDLTALARRHEL